MEKVNDVPFDVFVTELNIAKLPNIASMVVSFRKYFDNIIKSRKIALFKIIDIILGNQHQINLDLMTSINVLNEQNAQLQYRVTLLEQRIMYLNQY